MESAVEETKQKVRTENINKQARKVKLLQQERENRDLTDAEKKERSTLIAKQKFKAITSDEQLRLNELQQRAQMYSNKQSQQKNKGIGIGE